MTTSLEHPAAALAAIETPAQPIHLTRERIAEHPFASGLNPRYLHLLADCASSESFGAYRSIFEESGEANSFYLILSGGVALQTFVPGEGIVTLQTIGAGEALGWSWLYPPYRWHLSAVTTEPTELIKLDARRLREEIEENHDFGYEMTFRVGRTLMERLRATHVRVHALYHVPS